MITPVTRSEVKPLKNVKQKENGLYMERLSDIVPEIKQRLDIVEVIGERIPLNRQNMAVCPFHEDKKPSLSVQGQAQYFHCFGCGKGGDVIRFLELYEKKSFKEVLTSLGNSLGIPLDGVAASDGRELEQQRIIQDILTATAAYYHRNLPSDVMNYLIESRGLKPETVNLFQIGYADGGLRRYLTEDQRYPVDVCIKAGVLKPSEGSSSKDYFYKRLVIPNWRRGRVVHLTGRSLDGKEPKYLHLSGQIKHLFNEDALSAGDIVLAEGQFDCLTAIQCGHKAVGIYGVSGFGEKHQAKFDSCNVVYVCMDGDSAGREAGSEIGQILADKAIMVELPDNTDVNELVLKRGEGALKALLDEGRKYLDIEIDHINSLPKNRQYEALGQFLPQLAKLEEFLRNIYIERIKKDFGLPKKTVERAVFASNNLSDRQCSEVEEHEAIPSHTNSEREEAEALLRDPDLIAKIAQVTERLGCVGEENNKILVYLALTSRISDSPISLIVKGDSSAGKSYLVETVSQLFPSDQLLSFTTLSPKSLYHRQDNLAHKALIIFERPGAEESDYSIRSLQSEKKLIISTSVKDPETGRWVAEDKEVAGPVAYIETTTQTHLHPENETRCFELFIDDSREQTIRIQETQRKKYMPADGLEQVDLRVWLVAQQLLKPLRVAIPYVDLIRFPSEPLRVRRDFQRFLTLIEVSALLHQHQREKTMSGGNECVLASLDDYAVAYKLASTVLQQTIKQISPKAEQLARKLFEHTAQSDSESLTRREINALLPDSPNTVKKYLRECVDQNVIEEDRSGKAFKYRLIKLPDECDNLLVSPEQLRAEYYGRKVGQLAKSDQSVFGQVSSLNHKELTASSQSHELGKGSLTL